MSIAEYICLGLAWNVFALFSENLLEYLLMAIIFLIPGLTLLLFRIITVRQSFRLLSNQSDFLLGLYISISVFGVVNAFLMPQRLAFPPSVFAMLILTLCLVLVFFPVFTFQRERYVYVAIPSRLFFNALVVFFIVGNAIAFAVFIPKILSTDFFDANQIRTGLVLNGENQFSGTLLDKLSINICLFFGVVQLLAMIIYFFKVYGSRSSFISFWLLLASTSYIGFTLVYAGREGLVYWGLSFILNLAIISTIYNVKIKVFKAILVFGLFASVPFFVITYSRFGVDVFFYIFMYFSQQIPLFSDFVSLDPELYHGAQNFAWFSDKLGFSYFYEQNDLNASYLQFGVTPWGFPTFVGSIFKDFGAWGTLVFFFWVTVIVVSCMRILKRKRALSLDRLLFYYLHVQVIFMGVFYFKHAFMSSYIVSHLFLVFLLFFLRGFGQFKDVKIVGR